MVVMVASSMSLQGLWHRLTTIMLAWLSESRFGQGLSIHALCNSEIVPTATVSDLIHRFDLTVLMMAVKKFDIRHRHPSTQHTNTWSEGS